MRPPRERVARSCQGSPDRRVRAQQGIIRDLGSQVRTRPSYPVGELDVLVIQVPRLPLDPFDSGANSSRVRLIGRLRSQSSAVILHARRGSAQRCDAGCSTTPPTTRSRGTRLRKRTVSRKALRGGARKLSFGSEGGSGAHRSGVRHLHGGAAAREQAARRQRTANHQCALRWGGGVDRQCHAAGARRARPASFSSVAIVAHE